MKVLPVILGASAAAALAITGCSSSPKSGTETLAGTTSSTAQHPTIPLKASGLFADTGSVTLSGNGGAGTGVIHLANGNITVHHGKGSSNGAPHVNPATCAASFSSKGAYKFLSGTGSYAGITGSGVYTVTFSGTLPRKNGKCNMSHNANPVKGTTKTVFLATGQAKL